MKFFTITACMTVALVAGCASHHALQVDPEALDDRSKLSCNVDLSSFENSLPGNTQAGHSGATWEVTGLAESIEQEIEQWQPDQSPGQASIDLELELLWAYSEPLSSQMYFTTVLVGRIDESETQVFRGMQDELHKGQAKTEFRRAVHTSLDFALDALHAALERRCETI